MTPQLPLTACLVVYNEGARITECVRPDKVDGCYLPEISGGDPVWNWQP